MMGRMKFLMVKEIIISLNEWIHKIYILIFNLLDNDAEYPSSTFNDYCMSFGISVEHPIVYVHTQNSFAESLIKRLQLIICPLLIKAKLPSYVWGHVILHAANMIRDMPSFYHKQFTHQLAFDQIFDISHFKVFGCVVYVPITSSQRSKMGPRKRTGVYVILIYRLYFSVWCLSF